MSNKNSGFANLFILIGMLIVAAGLPIATSLVQRNQENRSSAASNCYCAGINATITAQYPCGLAGGTWTCPTAKCSGGDGKNKCISRGETGWVYSCVSGVWTNGKSCGEGIPCASNGIGCGESDTKITYFYYSNLSCLREDFISQDQCESMHGTCYSFESECIDAHLNNAVCGNTKYTCLNNGKLSNSGEMKDYYYWQCIDKTSGEIAPCEQSKPIITDGFGPIEGVSCGTKKYNCNGDALPSKPEKTEFKYTWVCIKQDEARAIGCELPRKHILKASLGNPPTPIPTLTPDGACGSSLGTCDRGYPEWDTQDNINQIYRWYCIGTENRILCVIAKPITPALDITAIEDEPEDTIHKSSLTTLYDDSPEKEANISSPEPDSSLVLTVEEDVDEDNPTPTLKQSSKLTVKYDINNDGVINSIDFSQWKIFFINDDIRGDLNYDGSVNSIDGLQIKINM